MIAIDPRSALEKVKVGNLGNFERIRGFFFESFKIDNNKTVDVASCRAGQESCLIRKEDIKLTVSTPFPPILFVSLERVRISSGSAGIQEIVSFLSCISLVFRLSDVFLIPDSSTDAFYSISALVCEDCEGR
mmetsp:Transcript_3623/g.5459  ORF Transcript_3623/g.5459 Transcript_3623/m.5459 type:complete len:132 (-) Transcript_3623:1058-1453(-)